MERLWKWALRYGGLAGIIYETLAHDFERYLLLLIFAAMMGLADFTDVLKDAFKQLINRGGSGSSG